MTDKDLFEISDMVQAWLDRFKSSRKAQGLRIFTAIIYAAGRVRQLNEALEKQQKKLA